MAFEIWNRDNWGRSRAVPLETTQTIDFAFLQIIIYSKNNPDNLFFILEKDRTTSKIRGVAHHSKYYPAKDCKSCNNEATLYCDKEEKRIICPRCNGASFKPERY